MPNKHAITVYNASAGSGKTFTLVKTYLSLLLTSPRSDYFKKILAITFTNKAVAEMKERILTNLEEFADPKILSASTDMFGAIVKETGIEKDKIHHRAKNALNYILHNYASFDVQTIDSFNHRLIRTFAKDLKLSSNFEISLEESQLLTEAVDRVITMAGKQDLLTEVMVNFALEKSDEDKSWDISYDLNEISKLLVNESHKPHVDKLTGKSLQDFLSLKKTILENIKISEKEISRLAHDFFELLEKHNLEPSNFSRGSVPNYFEKLKDKNYPDKYDSQWMQDFGETPLYTKTLQKSEPGIACVIDDVTPIIAGQFEKSKGLVFTWHFLRTVLKNVNSLSLLSYIHKEFAALYTEKNVLPISSFNARIHKEIVGQPAPFIYERLGEKYSHYFIDEFQDTSKLQWENLIPLIDAAVSQETILGEKGSLMLVGDAKQSIYRWRGGLPEQFMGLSKTENPFSNPDKITVSLEKNYRSFTEVINFNNSFFRHISAIFLSEDHRELFLEGSAQKTNSKEGGFVSLSFLEAENADESIALNTQKVLEIVQQQLDKGFQPEDICVLTRRNKESIAVSEILAENNIPILSSESIMLENSPEVIFMVNVLKLAVNFEDSVAKAEMLYFLHTIVDSKEPKHDFMKRFISCSEMKFADYLKELHIDFSFKNILSLPLYETCEKIAGAFGLSSTAQNYVQAFLDVVFSFYIKEEANIPAFLEYWEIKKDSLSIENSGNLNAVQIMTIHKAKGLEFPVVILPFADYKLHDLHRENAWFPLEKENFSGFSEFLIGLSRKIENFSPEAAEIYNEKLEQSEFDALNVLYVALTRAEEQLFIICSKKDARSEATVPYLFMDYLKNLGIWEEGKLEYTFGNPDKIQTGKEQLETDNPFILKAADFYNDKKDIQIATGASLLWDTELGKAIEKGNLVHDIMTEIKTVEDLDQTFSSFIADGILTEAQAVPLEKTVKEIIHHADLQEYFLPSAEVETERDIFTKEGKILRPDRINFSADKNVAIIDYKTGTFLEKHRSQIEEYGRALEELGFNVKEKILVYTSGEIEIIKI